MLNINMQRELLLYFLNTNPDLFGVFIYYRLVSLSFVYANVVPKDKVNLYSFVNLYLLQVISTLT